MHVDVTATGMFGITGTEFRSVCSQVGGNPFILLISVLLVYFVINSSTHIYLLLKRRIQQRRFPYSDNSRLEF